MSQGQGVEASEAPSPLLLSKRDEAPPHNHRDADDALRHAVRGTIAILSRIVAQCAADAGGRHETGAELGGRVIIKQRIRRTLRAVGSADKRLIAVLARTSVSTASRALRELQWEGYVAASGTTRDRRFRLLQRG